MENGISKKKFVIIIISLLILFFIIIFLLLRYIEKISADDLIPTGNIEIFDINKCPECENEDDNSNDDETNIDDNENSNTSIQHSYKDKLNTNTNIQNNYNDKESANNSVQNSASYGVFAYDNEHNFDENIDLKIFKQTSYYVKEGTIAPQSSNSYQFIVKNSTDVNIKYDLDFIEDNKYNINMKYRLKRNGSYVVGDAQNYVTAKELSQHTINLGINNYDVYMLDWKWFESPNDTEIGSQLDSHYGLSIKLYAEGK